MQSTPDTSRLLVIDATHHPGGAAEAMSVLAQVPVVLRTLVLIVVAMTGILILLPAALGAAAIQALGPA
jgi:hypothetical protein